MRCGRRRFPEAENARHCRRRLYGGHIRRALCPLPDFRCGRRYGFLALCGRRNANDRRRQRIVRRAAEHGGLLGCGDFDDRPVVERRCLADNGLWIENFRAAAGARQHHLGLLANVRLVTEAHLQLAGMHVNVHGSRRQTQRKRAHRILPDHDAAAHGHLERLSDERRADGAAIDKEKFLRTVGARQLVQTDQSADSEAALRFVHQQHLLRCLAAVYGQRGMTNIAVAVAVIDGAAVADEAHGRAGVAQYEPRDHIGDHARLRGWLFEEAAPHGRIEEQVAHDDGRSLRAPRLGHVHNAAALDLQLQSGIAAFLACGHRNARHRRDGRQRLAAEAQRHNVAQAVSGRDF